MQSSQSCVATHGKLRYGTRASRHDRDTTCDAPCVKQVASNDAKHNAACVNPDVNFFARDASRVNPSSSSPFRAAFSCHKHFIRSADSGAGNSPCPVPLRGRVHRRAFPREGPGGGGAGSFSEGCEAIFTLVPSTSSFDSRILMSKSKFNMTPNWWA